MQNELRDLVDKHGIFAVLDQLSGVCGQNSEQPGKHSADWEMMEDAINAAASKALDLFAE